MSDLVEIAVGKGGVVALLIAIVIMLIYHYNKHFIPVNKQTFLELLSKQKEVNQSLQDTLKNVLKHNETIVKSLDEVKNTNLLLMGNILDENKLNRIKKLMSERKITMQEALKIIEDSENGIS